MTPLDRSLTDDRLDAAVTRLDPAARTLTQAEQHRADDLKARLMTSEPDGNVLGRPSQPGPARRRSRARWVALGAGLATVTAGLVLAPMFTDEEVRSTAWSATPTALSGDTARELGEQCLDAAEKGYARNREFGQSGGSAQEPDGSFDPDQRRAMRLVLGERRGPHDVVVMGNAAGYELTCSRHGDQGEPLASGGLYPLTTPAAASLSVTAQSEATERIRDGRFVRETLTIASGRVGRDIVGVRLDTPAGEVIATVRNGWFAASWPGSDPVDIGPLQDVTVTLVRDDGTTVGPIPFADLPGRDLPDGMIEDAPAPS